MKVLVSGPIADCKAVACAWVNASKGDLPPIRLDEGSTSQDKFTAASLIDPVRVRVAVHDDGRTRMWNGAASDLKNQRIGWYVQWSQEMHQLTVPVDWP